MDTSSYLQILVRDRRSIFSVRSTNLLHEVRFVDLRRYSGKKRNFFRCYIRSTRPWIRAIRSNQIDLKHINQNTGDKVEIGIDLREYYPSVEWDILGVPAERHKKYYPCCDEPYPDIFFNITLRRKTLFYTVNLIVPCVSISYLSVLAFYLPADSGEKIALCINILLSQTMFFLLISEIIPSTSLALPLLGKYLLFTMILVGLSVVITIVILNVHYRKPSTHKMAPWVRKIFIRRLPKLLLMRVPDDLLNDLAAHKMHGRGRSGKKSKFNAAVAAAVQSSSIVSSPDSARHQRIGGECPFSWRVDWKRYTRCNDITRVVPQDATDCTRQPRITDSWGGSVDTTDFPRWCPGWTSPWATWRPGKNILSSSRRLCTTWCSFNTTYNAKTSSTRYVFFAIYG